MPENSCCTPTLASLDSYRHILYRHSGYTPCILHGLWTTQRVLVYKHSRFGGQYPPLFFLILSPPCPLSLPPLLTCKYLLLFLFLTRTWRIAATYWARKAYQSILGSTSVLGAVQVCTRHTRAVPRVGNVVLKLSNISPLAGAMLHPFHSRCSILSNS